MQVPRSLLTISWILDYILVLSIIFYPSDNEIHPIDLRGGE